MKRYVLEAELQESPLGDTVKYDDVRSVANEIHGIAEMVMDTNPDHVFIHAQLNMIVKRLVGDH